MIYKFLYHSYIPFILHKLLLLHFNKIPFSGTHHRTGASQDLKRSTHGAHGGRRDTGIAAWHRSRVRGAPLSKWAIHSDVGKPTINLPWLGMVDGVVMVYLGWLKPQLDEWKIPTYGMFHMGGWNLPRIFFFVHIQVETQPTSWSPLAVNQIGDSGTKHRDTTVVIQLVEKNQKVN